MPANEGYSPDIRSFSRQTVRIRDESEATVSRNGEARRWPVVLGVLLVPAIIAVIAAVLILPQLWVVAVNDASAREVETSLRDLPLPEDTEFIDSLSVAAKLSGNGNGMQYLGALMIRSDLSLDELETFYESQAGEELSMIGVHPSGGLDGLHRTPGFLGQPGEPGTFIVSAWGDGPGWFFSDTDLRGH